MNEEEKIDQQNITTTKGSEMEDWEKKHDELLREFHDFCEEAWDICDDENKTFADVMGFVGEKQDSLVERTNK